MVGFIIKYSLNGYGFGRETIYLRKLSNIEFTSDMHNKEGGDRWLWR